MRTVALVNPQLARAPGIGVCDPRPWTTRCLATACSVFRAPEELAGHDVRLIDLRLLAGWDDYDSGGA